MPNDSSNSASGSGGAADELFGLSELGVRVMDQSTLERTVHAKANREIAEKEMEAEQKRLVRVEAALLRKREQIEKSNETVAKVSSKTVRYQNALDRIERLEAEVEELEDERRRITDHIGQLELQASVGEAQPTHDSIEPTDITPEVAIKSEHDTEASGNQNNASPNALAAMILPKRKAAKAAEDRKYGLDQNEESSDESTYQPESSSRKKRRKTRTTSRTSEHSDEEPDDRDFTADENASTEDEDDAAVDSAELASDDSDALQLQQGQRSAVADDDGNELAYQERVFNWCTSRILARQGELDEEHGQRFLVKHESSLDCVAIGEQQVPRARLAEEPYLPDPGTVDHVVKSYDRGKPSLRVPRQIWERLLEYQKACMNWLFALHQQNAGGILGDEMGLGKTVQMAAFLASMYHSRLLDKPSIVVCPATLLRQWVSEFHAWWPALRVVILHSTGYGMRVSSGEDSTETGPIHDLTTNLSEGQEADMWQSLMSDGAGVGADTNAVEYDSADDYEYDAYGLRVRRKRRPRGYVDWKKRQQKKQKRSRDKKTSRTSRQNLLRAESLVDLVHQRGHVVVVTYSGLQIYQDVLLRRKWGYAVLDEGHTIRNPDADVTITCKRLDTRHRILVTGTPIQNNLTELWSLFDFIFPGRLGTLPVFNNQFAIPITVGGYASANSLQVRAAYRCACILRDLIDPYLLRRLKADVAKDLPQKSEQVLFCRLTPMQRRAYKAFLQSVDMERILQGKLQMLFGVDVARKICDHPDLLLLSTLPSAAGTHRESSTIKDVLAQASGERNVSNPGYNSDDNAEEYVGPIGADSIDSEDEVSGVGRNTKDLDSLPPDYGSYEKSGKLTIVRELLKMWKPQGHKVLIFSQTRQMLDIIESMVVEMADINYRRMDGSTPVQRRAVLIDEYNKNPDIYVFLLTTKVGGLGINLTGADRVILYSPDWNPSSDMQARERAWRLGQKRDVAIYRLMTAGTIEEKIYNRQIYKQFLTNKILADPKQKRFFHSQSLRDLFSLSGLGDEEDVFPGLGRAAIESNAVRNKFGLYNRAGEHADSTQAKSSQFPEPKNSHHLTDTGRIFADAQLFPESVDREDEHSVKGTTSRSENGKDADRRDERGSQIDSIGGVVRLEEYRPADNSDNDGYSDSGETSTDARKGRQSSRQRKDGQGHGHENDKDAGDVPVEQNGEDGEDRVLQSLFKMSGVHSAFQHDAIVNSKDGETQAIDREVDRIAQDARNALKQSQRARRQLDVNVPTWTGAAGNAGMPQTSGPSQSVPPPPSALLSSEIPMEVRSLGMRAVGTPRNRQSNLPQPSRTGAELSGTTTVYHPSIAARRPVASEIARPSSSVVPSLSMNNRSQGSARSDGAQFGSHAMSGMYSTDDTSAKAGGSALVGVRTVSSGHQGSMSLQSSNGNGGGERGTLSSSNILAGLRDRAGGADEVARTSGGGRYAADVSTRIVSTSEHRQQRGQGGASPYRTQQLPGANIRSGRSSASGRSHGAVLTRPQGKLAPHDASGTRDRGERGGGINGGRGSFGRQRSEDPGSAQAQNDSSVLSSNDMAVMQCIRQTLVDNGGELGSKALLEKVQADFAGVEQLRVRHLAQLVAHLETRQPKSEMSRAGIGRIVQKVWKLRERLES
ncbi:DNA repair protein rhp26 [Coemansia sp. Benny D160-2]|nr:DNA repair protein rhp26 [Coemansia sp. Benny D160-2]